MKNDRYLSNDRPEVLLVSAPSIMDITFSKAKSLYKPIEPLGLLYIAGNLERNGISTRLLDCNGTFLSLEESVREISVIRPAVLGISCLTAEAYLIEELLIKIRALIPETVIVMGNLHASYFSDYYIGRSLADIVVHGEGEEVMVDIVKALREKRPLGGIRGISFRDSSGDVVRTEGSNMVRDLDSLPLPAWHMAPLQNYRHHFYYNFDPKKTRMMITSRGCPIGCAFCVIHEGGRVRYESPDKIMEEMLLLIRDYGTTHINFLDAMFLAKHSRVIALCEMILKKNLKIKWACEAHVNYMNRDILGLMKRAGCESIYIGIEAGDNTLLKNVGKKSTVEQIRRAVNMAHEAGLKPVGFFMLGLPGETEELSRKTIDFSLSLPLDMAVFSITVPFVGSKMFEELKQKDPNFDQYNWDGFSNTGILGKNPPVWNAEALAYEKLRELQAMAMRKFHLRGRMILRHLKTLRYATFDDIKALFYVTWLILRG